MSIDVELDVDASCSFSPNDQIVTVSGDMRIDGALSAGTDPSGFVFDGTTSFLGGVSGSRNFNDVTITGSVTAPSGTLNVAGNFTDNGTFNANSGTINFNGGQTQLINGASATSFQNINITKASTTNSVTTASAKNLVGIITLSTNSAFNANGNLTLISNASGDATVAEIPSSAIFSGNVIYQRYLDSNNTRWRNLGLPIPTGVANLTSAGLTTGGSLYTYNENVTGAVDFGWVEETSTLLDTRGYTLYMYSGQVPATINTTGALNTTNVSLPVTFTNTGNAAADGWNFVNNPYASSIDWGDADWTKTNINANCAVWNGSTYDYFSTGLISSGQGFWIQTNASSPVLTARQGVKSNTGQTLQKVSNNDNELRILVENESNEIDKAYIRFREDATEEFDNQYDARKLVNAIHNISSLSEGGQDLAINTLPSSSCSRTVKLKLNQASGDYSLYIDGLNSISAGYDVILNDNFTGQTIEFNGSESYNFSVDGGTPESFGSERFELVFNSITLVDSSEPFYSVEDGCEEMEAFITLNDLQDGINYYLVDASDVKISNAKVASSGSATLVIDKSSLNSNELYSFSLVGTTDNECSGELNYANLVAYKYSSLPEITNVDVPGVCEGYNGAIKITAEGAPKFGSYRWYLDATTSESIAGETLSYLTIDDLSTANDTYYVSALNENGCEGNRVEVKIETYELVSPTVDNGTACVGGDVTLIAQGASENEYYRWYTSMDASDAITDANANQFVIEDISKSKAYYVSIVNSFGCESIRVEALAQIEVLESPELFVAGNILSVPTGFIYQWYVNDEKIEGATNNSIEVKSSGIYYVEVSNGNCKTLSNSRQLVVTGVDDVLNKLGLNIYPNPVSDKLYLKYSKNSFTFTLFDLKGNVILNDKYLVKKGEIGYFDMSNLKSGFYILNVEVETGSIIPLRVLKK